MSPQYSGKASVLVLGDHRLVREGIVRLLQSEADLQVAGQSASVEDAVMIISSTSVDLVLLDYDLTTQVTLTFLNRVSEIGFRGRFLVLANEISLAAAHRLVVGGASGILLKDCSPEVLCRAIREAIGGETWRTSATLASGIPPSNPPYERAPDFSIRQKQVIQGVLNGLPNKEIAARLHISEHCVKWTLHQLLRRTGTHTRSQLVRVIWESHPELF
jgi:DNA-binding NarL/FixJ family response regulator